MPDDNTEQQRKKRKSKWTTSYSNMSLLDTEGRLGFRIRDIKTVPLTSVLTKANYALEGDDSVLKTKEMVYEQIVDHILIEGYPTEAETYFKEANVNDLVYAIIKPIIVNFVRKSGRKGIQLLREKEIVSVDGEVGGNEEFVVMDIISVTERNYVFIIEGKRSSLGEAMKQCLLSLKDAGDNNGGGVVYGFVTTGQHWQMISYDGTLFQKTREMMVVFDGMDEDKESWMKEGSMLVDCMNLALSNGGIVRKDVVVVAE